MSINSSAIDVFRVLRLVGSSDELLRASDISKQLSISLNVTRRAIATLVQTGYLRRHEHWGRYEVGMATQQLANVLLDRFPIRRIALPTLRQLAFHSRGTASLNVRLGWYSVRLGSIGGGGNLFMHARKLGEPTLLGMIGPTQTILACLDDPVIELYWRFVGNISGENSKPEIRKKTQERVECIRAIGFCLEHDRENSETVSITVPIRSFTGAVIASISIEGTAQHILDPKRRMLSSALIEIIKTFESEGHSKPESFAGPFDYLNPNEIRFGLH